MVQTTQCRIAVPKIFFGYTGEAPIAQCNNPNNPNTCAKQFRLHHKAGACGHTAQGVELCVAIVVPGRTTFHDFSQHHPAAKREPIACEAIA